MLRLHNVRKQLGALVPCGPASSAHTHDKDTKRLFVTLRAFCYADPGYCFTHTRKALGQINACMGKGHGRASTQRDPHADATLHSAVVTCVCTSPGSRAFDSARKHTPIKSGTRLLEGCALHGDRSAAISFLATIQGVHRDGGGDSSICCAVHPCRRPRTREVSVLRNSSVSCFRLSHVSASNCFGRLSVRATTRDMAAVVTSGSPLQPMKACST